MTRSGTLRVLIAGGGVAAIECLLALRVLGGPRVEIALLAPEPEFVYRPVSVAEPFGRGEARRFSLSEIAHDQGATVHAGTLAAVDPIRKHVLLGSGAELDYDVLVIAVGARQRESLPGALTFGGPADVPALEALLDELDRGEIESVAFALTAAITWPLPLYELAVLTAARAPDRDVTLVSWEEEPLGVFGARASRAVSDLLAARGIRVRMPVRAVAAKPGVLLLEGSGRVRADRVVALPRLEGHRIVGVPADALGFIPTDLHGKVPGLADVYAAGDGTAFPLKQGGLAAQQADAVAESIAAGAGAAVEPRPFPAVMRGLLITGGEPLYLRADGSAATSVAMRDDSTVRGEPESVAARSALWWPPSKIAGRYLAPYLATARPVPLGASPLVDRAAPRRARGGGEHADALALTLLLADHDARWGDYDLALRSLEAAEALAGMLPPEYEAKRRTWERACASGGHAEPVHR